MRGTTTGWKSNGIERNGIEIDDALMIWKARDVYRAQSFVRGLVILYVLLVVSMFSLVGYWWLGLWLLAAQYGMVRAAILAFQLLRERYWMVHGHKKGRP